MEITDISFVLYDLDKERLSTLLSCRNMLQVPVSISQIYVIYRFNNAKPRHPRVVGRRTRAGT